MYKIAILASGSGTNAENIVKTFHNGSLLRVTTVLCDVAQAGVFERMQRLNVPAEYIPGPVWRNEPQIVVEKLKNAGVDLVVLAGFMRLVHKDIVDAFPHRIINIHPALLPNYGGKGMYGHHVHEAVIANGEKKSGVTVHYIDEHYDRGEILMQAEVEIVPGETAESLETKIHEAEYATFPRAIAEALRRITPQDPGNIAMPAEELPNIPAVPPAVDNDKVWADALHVDYDPQVAQQRVQKVQEKMYQQPPQIPQNININQPKCVEPMPPNYMILSILSTFLCSTIVGIIAIIFSSQVTSRYYAGDIQGAQRASRNVQICIIISFCLGVLTASLYLPMSMLTSIIAS